MITLLCENQKNPNIKRLIYNQSVNELIVEYISGQQRRFLNVSDAEWGIISSMNESVESYLNNRSSVNKQMLMD